MASLQNVRRRIKSVKNIQKITNAMDMIARSRFNAARDALISNEPYVYKTRDILRRVVTQMKGMEFEHPFIMTREDLKKREELGSGKFLFLVIAADKGLAGSFSSNVLKEAHETIEYDGEDSNEGSSESEEENYHKKNFDAIKDTISVKKAPRQNQLKATGGLMTAHSFKSSRQTSSGGGIPSTENLKVAKEYNDADFIEGVELITVGRKATTHFKHRGYNVIKSYNGISERPNYDVAVEIANLIIDRFMSGEITDVTMVYTKFKSAILCEPYDVTLLPVVTDDFAYAKNLDIKDEYIFEPDIHKILNDFMPHRLATRIYGAMLNSAASELSSRMNAMSNATDNAQELIRKLNLYYNKVRQAGITNEINEIVGGANALE